MVPMLPGWRYAPIRITIPAGSVTEALEDFPFLVKLSGASGRSAENITRIFSILGGDENRKRILVTTESGDPCYVEIKEWSTATQTAYLWVRVPRIDPGLTTHLYLYFDPLHAEMTDYVGDTGEVPAQAVWENGYAGVWHTSSGGQLLDSTRNANHGTIYGATATEGPLGTALAFDGVDDYVDCGNSVTLDPGANDFTLEVMAKAISGATRSPIVSKGGWYHVGYSIQMDNDARGYYFVAKPSGSNYKSVSLGLGPSWDWKYIGGSRSGNTLSAVVDGIARPNSALPPDASLTSSTPLRIGRYVYQGVSYFNGEVGFVALSSVARSPAWIAATNAALRDDLIVYSDPGDIVTFAATPHVGPASLTVQFTDQSTGAPTSWLWDFGDGYSSAEQHPIHIYETPGIYTVTLTVRNEHEAYRGIREGYITVGRPPATRYALSIYEIQAGRLPGWANEPILLTIPAGSVTGVLEDFPVLVKLSGASGKTAADVSKVFVALGSDANRKRICVTAGDGITPCYVEIKEWSTATQTAFLWVRVPRINPGLDTRLYLYYDPLHAEMTDYVGDTGETAAQRVWENGYVGVWHTPSGSTLLDSTVNANHGTIYGATEVDGPLGRCLSFDGVDDIVTVPHHTSLDPGTGDFSIESYVMFRPGDPADAWDEIVAKRQPGGRGYYLGSRHTGSELKTRFMMRDVTDVREDTPYIPHNYDTYYTVCAVLDRASDVQVVYVDKQSASTSPPPGDISSPGDLTIGYDPFLGPDAAVNGVISYVSISSVARSPAWIAATNLSLRDELIVYSDPGAPLTLAAYVDAYEYLSWTRRYRRPGAWKCQINKYLPAAKEFVPGRLVHFKRNGEDRLALIETRQISVDTSGRPSEQWTVAGREVLGILGDRLCLHGVSTGTGYDVQTGPAETVMRHYVNINAINPDDLSRIVPFLALSPVDDERGGSTAQKARFDVLTDLLESVCAASGLGYRGRWSWDDRRLYFEVINGVDRSDSVILSPALGNCTIKGYNESTNLAPSVAVVAGQGEAADRMVVGVGKETGLYGLARRERFVDARDLTTEADLRQRGAEKLAEDGDTTTLEIEYIQTAAYQYGDDYDIGDVVHVEYPDIAAMDARIVEIVEEYAREGERLTLVLGTEWPDLTGVLRLAQKDNAVKRV